MSELMTERDITDSPKHSRETRPGRTSYPFTESLGQWRNNFVTKYSYYGLVNISYGWMVIWSDVVEGTLVLDDKIDTV